MQGGHREVGLSIAVEILFRLQNGLTDAGLIACGHGSCLLQAECKKDTGSKTLVSGHIVGWEASAAFPLAQLHASLGQAGELATEMQVRVS